MFRSRSEPVADRVEAGDRGRLPGEGHVVAIEAASMRRQVSLQRGEQRVQVGLRGTAFGDQCLGQTP